jgi:hypothetical protein
VKQSLRSIAKWIFVTSYLCLVQRTWVYTRKHWTSNNIICIITWTVVEASRSHTWALVNRQQARRSIGSDPGSLDNSSRILVAPWTRDYNLAYWLYFLFTVVWTRRLLQDQWEIQSTIKIIKSVSRRLNCINISIHWNLVD